MAGRAIPALALERAMRHETVEVVASWDEEAGVWVAESDDVPGLVTEAATTEALVDKLRVLVPELLELNAPDRLRDGRPPRVRLTSRREVETVMPA